MNKKNEYFIKIKENIVFVKGKTEDNWPVVIPGKIANMITLETQK